MAMKYLTYAAIPLMAASLSTQAATVDQLNRQVQKLNQRLAAQDQRFRVNGFATFGFAISDEAMAYNGVNDELTFSRFSKAGIQMTFNMDPKNSVVVQMVSRAENGWDTSAEWAYFKHEFGGGLSGKIGRIRLPAYQLSEFLDVGYATPYAQVPAETYDSLDPFANMEGVDLTYSMDVGDNTATFQFVYGRAEDNEFDLRDILGLSAVLQADVWSARLAVSQATVDVVEPDAVTIVSTIYGEETTDLGGNFMSLGFTYDPGDLYFTTEYTQLEADGMIVDADALYATFGYRMGRLMPTLTYAMAESQDDDLRDISKITAGNAAIVAAGQAAAPAVAGGTATTEQQAAYDGMVQIIGGVEGIKAASDRNTTRIGLGLRYDMSPGTALKVQYDIIEVKDDKSGLFDDTAWATNAATGGENPDGANVLTISIDTVF